MIIEEKILTKLNLSKHAMSVKSMDVRGWKITRVHEHLTFNLSSVTIRGCT